jgi:hypothetical protein
MGASGESHLSARYRQSPILDVSAAVSADLYRLW